MLHTVSDLIMLQSLPLDIKIEKSKLRIQEWYEHWNGQVYVSFSGGKDSTVLLHLVRSLYPEVVGVFCNTGLEYPEIVKFVRETENIIIIKPKMKFKEVIEKYGYPIISKEQSQYIYEYRNTNSEINKDRRINGNKYGYGKISKKWLYLINAPFKISDYCCDKLKKNPFKKYEKETGYKPFIGSTAGESAGRRVRWLKNGCNSFNTTRKYSEPLSFWKEEDIWEYIKLFNIKYSTIYDKGCSRTGCMFCMFGVHREKEPNKFQLMKQTHPKLWNYCINKLGCGKVLDYINVKYE